MMRKRKEEIEKTEDNKNDLLKILEEIEKSIPIETQLECTEYRKSVSRGIAVTEKETTVTFKSIPDKSFTEAFSVPSLILFDSFDRLVHDNEEDIANMHYAEYCEIWFDGNIISTEARNMVVKDAKENMFSGFESDGEEKSYIIKAVKYRDHARIRISNGSEAHEIIVALPDSSRYLYIGITGSFCKINDIKIETDVREIGPGEIERIADEISYINHIEGDIPNIQIDSARSAATDGILIEDGMRLSFKAKALPTASLAWHCPYIVIFTSDDKKVFGKNYSEIALIRFNGEMKRNKDVCDARIAVEKSGEYEDVAEWKKKSMKGYGSMVHFSRSRKKIVVSTSNLGIELRCTIELKKNIKNVYAALTGDQCALTNIMII